MKNEKSNSLRRYLRREKSRIHREVLDTKNQRELIEGLYKKYLPKNDNSGNIQSSGK